MKKVFTTILAASMMLIGANAFAQASIDVGFVNSTDNYKTGSTKNNTNLNGFYVGAAYNVPLAESLSVAPGIYYTLVTKSNANSYAGIVSTKSDVQEHYLSVPVMFNYTLFSLSDGISAKLYAGPTFAYGIASKDKISGSIAGFSGDTTIDNYDDSYNYNRFDVMVGGGLAVDFYDMVRFNVGYDYGLLNRYTGDADITRHRSQFRLGVAYLF